MTGSDSWPSQLSASLTSTHTPFCTLGEGGEGREEEDDDKEKHSLLPPHLGCLFPKASVVSVAQENSLSPYLLPTTYLPKQVLCRLLLVAAHTHTLSVKRK